MQSSTIISRLDLIMMQSLILLHYDRRPECMQMVRRGHYRDDDDMENDAKAAVVQVNNA